MGEQRALPRVGEIILGKYRIVREIGRGGMGVVFEALNTTTDGSVALKMLSHEASENAELVLRMSREARVTAKMRSRFVGRVFDYERMPMPDGSPVLVMELLEGRDLGSELRSRGGKVPVGEAVAYVLEACAGVAAAHAAGVVHRDIKPANLFLDTRNRSIRVLDFGISKILSSEAPELTSPLDAIGTVSYMSPEQLRASRDVDVRSDVWSLGIVLYRAIIGHPIVKGTGGEVAARVLDDKPMPRIDSHRPDVPTHLANIVATALAKDPHARFPDARALGLALETFADPTPITRLAVDELLALQMDPNAQLGTIPDTVAAASSKHFAREAHDKDTTTQSLDPPTPLTRGNWEAGIGIVQAAPIPRAASPVMILRQPKAQQRTTAFMVVATGFALATTIAAMFILQGPSAESPAASPPSRSSAPPLQQQPANPSLAPSSHLALPPAATVPSATTSAIATAVAAAPKSSTTPPATRPLKPATAPPSSGTPQQPARDEYDNPVRF